MHAADASGPCGKYEWVSWNVSCGEWQDCHEEDFS